MTTHTNPAIARLTFTLDVQPDDDHYEESIVLVVRDPETGEVYLKNVPGGYREAEATEERLESMGVQVLMRIEGEANLAMGQNSAWAKF